MAQTQLALYNLALSIAGADFTIAAVDEKSVAAEACQLWYENVRHVVLRSAHWNSAKRFARLDEEQARTSAEWEDYDPEPGYGFSYTLPTDFLAARFLSNFAEFSLGITSNRKVISTNQTPSPVLSYTADVVDPVSWEPDLYQAMAYSLAAHITMPLTGKPTRVRQNMNVAYELVLQARANTANEMHRLLSSRPEVLALRGTDYAVSAPFIYPYGSFFAGTGAPTA